MIDMVYQTAWEMGLKTTYYCRTLGATDAEKSTIHDKKLNAVQVEPKICSIDNPECEACQ
jgi:ribonucleoside-diphosphate reductase alpha chain